MPVNFDKIRELREAARLTQTAAAAHANKLNPRLFRGAAGRVQWADVETGRVHDPHISTLETVAAVLGCRVEDLLAPTRATAAPVKRPPDDCGRSDGITGSAIITEECRAQRLDD